MKIYNQNFSNFDCITKLKRSFANTIIEKRRKTQENFKEISVSIFNPIFFYSLITSYHFMEKLKKKMKKLLLQMPILSL